MERKLATIRKISIIEPIEGADKIELATVDGWKVIVAKNVGHKVGDLVVYCEIDSFLPIRDEFEFLRKSSYKKMSDGSEGFRLKTIRLRGQLSQGLLLPISVLDEYKYLPLEGDDVTEILGIIKYEPPIKFTSLPKLVLICLSMSKCSKILALPVWSLTIFSSCGLLALMYFLISSNKN
jgi:RNA ligase (TIGR02306 family)